MMLGFIRVVLFGSGSIVFSLFLFLCCFFLIRGRFSFSLSAEATFLPVLLKADLFIYSWFLDLISVFFVEA
jgi:hypothetical protein